MDLSMTGLVKALLPRTPLILKTAVLNSLSMSPNSSKQDARTEIVVNIVRSFFDVQKPINYLQHISTKDPGIKGAMWISKVTIPASAETAIGARDALVRGIEEAGDGQETYTLPDIAPVEAEWTGYREGVDKNALQPNISEEEKYTNLMSEVESPVTILYFHGGAYFLMGLSGHRGSLSHLAKLTKGRCLSVRYRLAPQHPFPAQLLDGLIAYLSLLSPPPGSSHAPVPASSIIFSGDSAGGNLSFALLQLLLSLQRAGVTSIPFHSADVPLQLPAGVAGNSPWLDISRSMPSTTTNAQYDYLNAPVAPGEPESPLPDHIWPTQPPRVQIFCNASILTHPLASPLAATPEQWRGCPPVFMIAGTEGLTDEIAITARRIHASNSPTSSKPTPVIFAGYEGMPHVFTMLFPQSPAGKQCLTTWAQFCLDAVAGKVQPTETSSWCKAFSSATKFEHVRFEELNDVSDEEADRLMAEAKRATVTREAELVRLWKVAQERDQGEEETKAKARL